MQWDEDAINWDNKLQLQYVSTEHLPHYLPNQLMAHSKIHIDEKQEHYINKHDDLKHFKYELDTCCNFMLKKKPT